MNPVLNPIHGLVTQLRSGRSSLPELINNMQANGQCQQRGQPLSSHPYLNHNVNGSYDAYEVNASYNVQRARAGDNSMQNVTHQSSQRQNDNFFATNSLLYYYQNSQNVSNQNNTTVRRSQAMLAQKAPVCTNPQSAMPQSNVMYCQSQVMHQHTLNQSQNLRMENLSVPRTNPTSPTIQLSCYTQQSVVQTSMHSQTSQQATYTSPHTQNKQFAFSNAQNGELYTFSPVTSSCANNQRVQNNCVSQTNDHRALPSVNGCSAFSDVMITNYAKGQIHSQRTLAVQTQHPPPQSQETMPQTLIGISNLKTTQSVRPGSNDRNSHTHLQKKLSATPFQSTIPANVQSFEQLLTNSLFYDKMDDVSNKFNSSAPLNQTFQLKRCEASDMVNTESSAQAKDCTLQTSPGRAQRAVAVVLPLSQENTPSDPPTPTNLSPSNPASDSCFLKSAQVDKDNTLDAACLKEKLYHSTYGSNKNFTDETNFSSLKEIESIVHNGGIKLSECRRTFRRIMDESYLPKVNKSKSENKKSPKPQKQVEKELSPVPPTEWTLGMLYKKISELENKEIEPTSEKKQQNNSVMQIIVTFWNGNAKAMLKEARNGLLSKEMVKIKTFCRETDINMVVLSQNHNDDSTKYHVLQPGEVYEENNPYTSSWLNINQLDDIDKEFGLPYFFKYCQNDRRSVKSEQTSKQENPIQIGAESEVLKPAEEKTKEDFAPLLNNTDAEEHDTLAHPDPDAESRAEENICGSDSPNYSFKIEVLPPEEAKVIFEQSKCDSPQIMNSSPEIPESGLKNTKKKTCHVTPLKEICCFEKWQEKILGLTPERKCNCEDKDQNEGELGNKSGWFMGIVDLTGDDDDVPMFTEESENNLEDKSPYNSMIIVSSESEDASQAFEDGCANQTDLSQEDAGIHTNTPDYSNVNETEMAIGDKLFNWEQDCRKYPETSDAETVDPLSSQSVNLNVCENKRNNETFASDDSDPLPRPRRKPKLDSNLKSQTILESFSKCKNHHVETVELALYGSKNKTCVSDSSQLRHRQHNAPSTCEKAQGVPRRLFVKFNHFTEGEKKESETTENMSAKQRIHEKWKKSLPLSTIRLKRKNKKFTIVGTNLGTTLRLKSVKNKDKRAASKRKNNNPDDGQCHKTKKTRVDGGAQHMREKPLQANVLKFDVLPNTFNFKEGFNDTGPTTDIKADEKNVSVPAEGSPRRMKTKGAWCDESTGKSAPESTESTGVFQEFQKRYKMRQSLTHE